MEVNSGISFLYGKLNFEIEILKNLSKMEVGKVTK